MNVDPNTEVQRLIAAFPASVEALRRLGIDVTCNESLREACRRAGITLADVQSALSNIDWSVEDGTTA